jgi:hypothetical protein
MEPKVELEHHTGFSVLRIIVGPGEIYGVRSYMVGRLRKCARQLRRVIKDHRISEADAAYLLRKNEEMAVAIDIREIERLRLEEKARMQHLEKEALERHRNGASWAVPVPATPVHVEPDRKVRHAQTIPEVAARLAITRPGQEVKDPHNQQTPDQDDASPDNCETLKAERFLRRLSWLIPRRQREAILGDLLEDFTEFRKTGWTEKQLIRYARWQLAITFGWRLLKWVISILSLVVTLFRTLG